MGDLSQDSGNETSPNDADGEVPSVEAIVAAFRKAAGGRAKQRDLGQPVSDRSALEPPSTPTMSPAEMIDETITAFRKAERRAAERSGKLREAETKASAVLPGARSPADKTSPYWRRSEAEAPEAARGAKPSSETSGAPTEAGTEQERATGEANSSDDLALAFRKALSKREHASEGPSPVEGERHEPEVSGGKSLDTESQSSPEHDTPLISPSTLPARPDPSFLWVTDSPSGETAAVTVEALSEPRVREAGALLLRGGGDQPYQLLKRIRHHPQASVYLKPVFWRRTPGQQSPVTDHVDGTWTLGAGEEALDALRAQAATINQRVSDLGEVEEAEDAELRVVRFVATRSVEFAPRRVAEEGAKERMVYPKLAPLLGRSSQNKDWSGEELAEILSTAVRRLREKESSGS